MQVVNPIDIEDALRIDLSALISGYRFYCKPIPPDLKAGDVVIYPLGGARVSGASHDYDVSIDCYADDDADAREMVNAVHGATVSLPLRTTATQYSDVSANLPYANDDPRAPQLTRYTFRATVTSPGIRILF